MIYHATRRRLPKARRALAMGRLKQYSLKRELAQRFIQKRRVRVPSAPPFWSLGPKNRIPTVIESASFRVIYHARGRAAAESPQRGVGLKARKATSKKCELAQHFLLIGFESRRLRHSPP